jgi:outer membrane protein assembly factor BamB
VSFVVEILCIHSIVMKIMGLFIGFHSQGGLLYVAAATVLAVAFQWNRAQAGDNWPEFRGPNGDGQSDAVGLPMHWNENQNIKWKVAIHDKGWSSPVIWGNQIWLTTATVDGHKLFVLCVDRDTGKVLHDIKLFDVEKPGFCIPTNSYASPTPVIEAGRVYVNFGTYGTACLDTATGKTLWQRRDLPCDHFRAPGSSPILYGDSLFVNFDGFDVQYVVALDKTTGETRWKSNRDIDYGTTNGDFKKAYCTPKVIQVNGQAQLISPSAVATIAYDPASGRELWKVYHGGMNAAARPLFGDGRVFLTTGDGGAMFAGGWHRLLAIRPDGHGDVTKSNVLWTHDKAVPARSSFLLVGALLYMVSDNGVASCLEARSGDEVWQHRLGGTYYASPIYAEGRIFFFDDAGTSHVMEAGREPKVLAQNHLDAGCMASTAVSGKALFVRTKTHLYRIEKDENKN